MFLVDGLVGRVQCILNGVDGVGDVGLYLRVFGLFAQFLYRKMASQTKVFREVEGLSWSTYRQHKRIPG